jgi:hypothetical protein
MDGVLDEIVLQVQSSTSHPSGSIPTLALGGRGDPMAMLTKTDIPDKFQFQVHNNILYEPTQPPPPTPALALPKWTGLSPQLVIPGIKAGCRPRWCRVAHLHTCTLAVLHCIILAERTAQGQFPTFVRRVQFPPLPLPLPTGASVLTLS